MLPAQSAWWKLEKDTSLKNLKWERNKINENAKLDFTLARVSLMKYKVFKKIKLISKYASNRIIREINSTLK